MVAVTILLSKHTIMQLVVTIQSVARRLTANCYTVPPWGNPLKVPCTQNVHLISACLSGRLQQACTSTSGDLALRLSIR